MGIRDIGVALLVVFIWGSNVTAARFGTFQFPPLFLIGLRLALVAALLCWLIRPPFGRWRQLVAVGLTMGALHFGLAFVALTRLDAGTTVILMQISVPLASVFAYLFFGDRLGWRGAAGMALGVAGVAVMLGEPRVAGEWGMVAVALVSALFFAIANIQIKLLGAIPPLTLNAWIAAASAPALLAASAVLEDGQMAALAGAGWWDWGAILYMVLVVSMVGHGLWYWLLPRHPVNRTMPFVLLAPVFGVLSGMVFLGESLTPPIAAGGMAVTLGVALILVRPPRPVPAAAE